MTLGRIESLESRRMLSGATMVPAEIYVLPSQTQQVHVDVHALFAKNTTTAAHVEEYSEEFHAELDAVFAAIAEGGMEVLEHPTEDPHHPVTDHPTEEHPIEEGHEESSEENEPVFEATLDEEHGIVHINFEHAHAFTVSFHKEGEEGHPSNVHHEEHGELSISIPHEDGKYELVIMSEEGHELFTATITREGDHLEMEIHEIEEHEHDHHHEHKHEEHGEHEHHEHHHHHHEHAHHHHHHHHEHEHEHGHGHHEHEHEHEHEEHEEHGWGLHSAFGGHHEGHGDHGHSGEHHDGHHAHHSGSHGHDDTHSEHHTNHELAHGNSHDQNHEHQTPHRIWHEQNAQAILAVLAMMNGAGLAMEPEEDEKKTFPPRLFVDPNQRKSA